MALSDNDVKSELSYAYLHAVAARAALSCEVTSRHSDAAGVDAVLRARGLPRPPARYSELTVEVQLKATSEPLAEQGGRHSFWLKREHYDKLRSTVVRPPRILVVLLLPANPQDWLTVTEAELVARRCAYWVSLFGAPPSANTSGQTVYLPRANLFTVEALRGLVEKLAREEDIPYVV